jgi:phospholipid/cholesterol/gamma-HCH transport system ATP-binding protein
VNTRAVSGRAEQALQARTGVQFQDGALFSSLTVADNIIVPIREHAGLDEPLMQSIAALKIAMAGLPPDTGDKKPSELSGGMRKRASLARALALDPELLFLDEPTAGLDPDRSESFVALIEELRREMHLSVVMVTHDLDTLVSLADRVAVLCEQRLLAVGPLREITALDHPFVCNFFQGERGRRALEVLEDVQRLMPI